MSENKLNRLDKFKGDSGVVRETIELLQTMVRTDTSNPPGNEMKLAKILKEIFQNEKNPLISTKIFETAPNRGNLLVKIKGSGPESSPSWGFAAHLDVVPAKSLDDWDYPPFSGEIVKMEHDQFIWGRGTFDMKQVGTSYIMAMLTLLREGFQPKGNIKLIFEADEERGGKEGMGILVDKYWEDIQVDCLITEGAGYKLPTGKDFAIQRGEKGKCQTKVEASGISGHGSTPESFNKYAIYKLVTVLNKIRKHKSEIHMIKEYKNTVNSASIPGIIKFLIKRKSIVRGVLKFLSKLTNEPFDKFFLPMITDTIVPTVIKAGHKVNVISPKAELLLDIRTLPDHDSNYIYNKLEKIFGKKLFQELKLSPIDQTDSTSSSIDTEYYKIIENTTREIYPGANLVPILDIAGTDMKHIRKKNIPCYGFNFMLKDPDLSYNDLINMSHAPNERVSVKNLMLATEFCYRLMKKL
jgi:acetylornithine deacetylase/succinyl-diaminopimelate desuccinylase-like protein